MRDALHVEAPLDHADRILLAAVQQDARAPQAALGRLVGLSPAAVNRRLRRLVDVGVIEHTASIVAQDKLGHPLTVITHIEAVSEEPARLDELRDALTSLPQVQQCYYVTGEWDFVLVLALRDMDQYTAITRQVFFASGNVRRFKTFVVMDRAKVGLVVPTEVAAGDAAAPPNTHQDVPPRRP